MKTLITYYTFTGITEKVVQLYADILRKKSEVAVQRLKPKEETKSFLLQCKAALTRKRADLSDENLIFDASPYDLIIIGSPVWAFAPTPAINSYLDRVSGLTAKKVVVLLTSGSGAGVKRCFNTMRIILQSKGVSSIEEINIPNTKMGDENFIRSSIENLIQ
jgi:flavodoxin